MKLRSALPIILCSFTLSTNSSITNGTSDDADTPPCHTCNISPSSIDNFVLSGTISLALLCIGFAGIILVKVSINHKYGDPATKVKSSPRPPKFSLIKTHRLIKKSPLADKQASFAKPSMKSNRHDKISLY